jgi:hypothetical protein
MRVDYTLPALQPWAPAETPEISAEGGSSFQDLVRGGAAELPQTVDALLRLDVRPFTGTYVGPPPRPPVLAAHDAESQRQQWYGMLHRHSGGTGMGTRTHGGRGQSVQNMMEMLRDMQDMEDSIVSQAVGLSRG